MLLYTSLCETNEPHCLSILFSVSSEEDEFGSNLYVYWQVLETENSGTFPIEFKHIKDIENSRMTPELSNKIKELVYSAYLLTN